MTVTNIRKAHAEGTMFFCEIDGTTYSIDTSGKNEYVDQLQAAITNGAAVAPFVDVSQPLQPWESRDSEGAIVADVNKAREFFRNQVERAFVTALSDGVTVEIGGQPYVFDCDDAAQSKITSAVTLAQAAAQAGLAFVPIPWTLANNTIYTITSLAQLLQIGITLGAHVQSRYAIRNRHKVAINDLQNLEQMQAYNVGGIDW